MILSKESDSFVDDDEDVDDAVFVVLEDADVFDDAGGGWMRLSTIQLVELI